MGCSYSTPDGDTSFKEKYKISKQIDKELAKEREKKEMKILLLGPGESGKSTFFKQMRLLSTKENSFPLDFKIKHRSAVYTNVLCGIKAILNFLLSENCENLALSEESQPVAKRILACSDFEWSREIAEDIITLWKDPAVKASVVHRGKLFQLDDSAEYFFGNLDRIKQEEYIPSDVDILRTRVRTTAIEEAELTVQDFQFRLIDVGGQRSERRKWIHCFEGVSAVIFCVAINEYDMKLREDNKTNRMKEAINIWEGISNSPWFWTTTFILFLNKNDLFQEKIQTVDLSCCFSTYKGGCNYDAAAKYVDMRFREKNHAPHPVFTHFTVAVDTENVTFVFSAVKLTILKSSLKILM